jgi:hypothetical protein
MKGLYRKEFKQAVLKEYYSLEGNGVLAEVTAIAMASSL